LKGDSLAKARRALRKGHCELGKVRRAHANRSGALVVVSQGIHAGQRRAKHAKVGVRLDAG
jgi:hypothetical protein